jgi:hypothetical protein
MKTSQFKHLIKEAVKEALIEVLLHRPSISIDQKKVDTPEVKTNSQVKPISSNPLMEMINQTRANMTTEEYRNITSASPAPPPTFTTSTLQENRYSGPQVGIDISNLGFIQKAKQVLDLAENKDKQRHGL